MNRRFVGLVTLCTVVSMWIVVTTPWFDGQRMVDSLKLPSPLDLWKASKQIGQYLPLYALMTLARVIFSLMIGGLLGVGLALVMSRYPLVDAVFDPLIELVRPIPPFALIPFVIFAVGLGNEGQVLITSLACFMVMVVSSHNAILNTNNTYLRIARSFGSDKLNTYLSIILPSIAWQCLTAMRVASATAFGIACAAEYLGANGGIGYMIRNARTTLHTDVILLGVLILGFQSWLVDFSLRRIQALTNKWRPPSEVAEL